MGLSVEDWKAARYRSGRIWHCAPALNFGKMMKELREQEDKFCGEITSRLRALVAVDPDDQRPPLNSERVN